MTGSLGAVGSSQVLKYNTDTLKAPLDKSSNEPLLQFSTARNDLSNSDKVKQFCDNFEKDDNYSLNKKPSNFKIACSAGGTIAGGAVGVGTVLILTASAPVSLPALAAGSLAVALCAIAGGKAADLIADNIEQNQTPSHS